MVCAKTDVPKSDNHNNQWLFAKGMPYPLPNSLNRYSKIGPCVMVVAVNGIQTEPVVSFKANLFVFLYDTVGNVWERVADPWHTRFSKLQRFCPQHFSEH